LPLLIVNRSEHCPEHIKKTVAAVVKEVGKGLEGLLRGKKTDSDLLPTVTTFEVTHNARSQTVRNDVGIMSTPNHAQSRGFNVATLRAQGLTNERPGGVLTCHPPGHPFACLAPLRAR